MRTLSLGKLPRAVRFGAPMAAIAIAAAACGSSTNSGNSASGGGGSPSQAPTSGGSAVTVETHSGDMGTFLTDQSGKTLYLFTSDTAMKSTCTSACTSLWPPLTTKGAVKGADGVTASKLSTITLSNGSKQVTYAGHPLYTYSGDSGAGQTNGEGSDTFGAKWWLVAPTGKQITTTSAGSSSPSPSPSKSSGGSGAGGGWA